MKTAKKPIKVGDKVRCTKPVQVTTEHSGKVAGTVKAIDGGKATIEVKSPRQVEKCGSCGNPWNLSENMSTGEIRCMEPECGHDHGFINVDIVVSLNILEHYK